MEHGDDLDLGLPLPLSMPLAGGHRPGPQGWHIPRPSLSGGSGSAASASGCSGCSRRGSGPGTGKGVAGCLCHGRHSTSSQGSSSSSTASNNSTQVCKGGGQARTGRAEEPKSTTASGHVGQATSCTSPTSLQSRAQRKLHLSSNLRGIKIKI